jgi:hypothetical protein
MSVILAQGMNKGKNRRYYDLLKKTLLENDLMKKPSRIFILDELDLQLNKSVCSRQIGYHRRPFILVCRKGRKHICCIVGHFLQPARIFKGVNKKQEFEGD